MSGRLRSRFWWEAASATFTGLLAAVTVASRGWIEVVFGVDLDRGDGSLEWAAVVASCCLTAVLATLARREWRRARPATS